MTKPKPLKVIDFKKKGNVIRLYFGNINDNDYWGDDWDDCPYEHNAGTVYSEYIKEIMEIAFPFDTCIVEPADDWSYNGNSPYRKEDFKKMKAPCLIIDNDTDNWNRDMYSRQLGNKNVWQLYFNDIYDDIIRNIYKYNGKIIKGATNGER